MEGLRHLRAYESQPSHERLQSADAKLSRCVSSYPSDVLPQFYLGVVKTLEGYPGLDDALKLFTPVSKSGPESLRLPAKYNLAAVHVEKYTDEDEEQAEQLLREVRRELIGVNSQVAQEHALLLAQVTSLLAYVVIRRRVEVPLRKKEALAPDALTEAHEVLALARHDAENPHVSGAVLRDVQAEIANAEGILAEDEALIAPDVNGKQAKSSEAAKKYRQALEHKRDWIPAMSNLARLQQRLLDQPAGAEKLWNEVLRLRPGDAYAHYMLGELFEKGNPPRLARAFESYWRAAADIDSAESRLKELERQVPTYQWPIDYAPPWRTSTP